MKKLLFIAMSISALTLPAAPRNGLTYPAAPTDNTVDTYFDFSVADPYRPLENDTAAETLQWVEAERALTDSYLSQIPYRDAIRSQLFKAQDYVRSGLLWRGNDGRYYFSRNSGLENQSTIFRKDSLNGPEEVFLNPNSLSDDGTVALTGLYISPDGKYTAYTISRSGSDWSEIFVMDTDTRELLQDHIEWAKFTGATWWKDGFFYSAYDKPTDGGELSDANENHRVYYHKIGTPQSEDTLFYEDAEHPLHFHSAYVPLDCSYIFIFGAGQGFGNSIIYRDLEDPDSQWIVMEPSQDITIDIIDVIDGTIYFMTTLDAPRAKLMSAPLTNPSRENWRELIPEPTDAVLSRASFSGDKLLVVMTKDASDHFYVYDKEGNRLHEIALPTVGSIGFTCDHRHDEVYYVVVSYLSPWMHFALDTDTGVSTPMDRAEISGFNPDDYVTEEIFYPSADGTMIHAFMVRKKDLKKDGTNPTYIYGYGGFNIGLSPSFSSNRLLWLENGGIYVDTNLRGGSEYGDQWHEAGTKMNKINVFNDFIAAAEYLIAEGWTSPENIVIEGGSNGGLLVAACVNMRPDLYRVAIPRVGVQDMLRYHLFTIGWNWAPDYGTSADSPEMAEYLRSYSPLHNIKNDGTTYPSILVTTADHDDRVVPAHSFKYAAALQAADTGDNPKIIRIDSKAGHGAGKPIGKIIDEWADIYAFIFENLGITPITHPE